MIGEQMEGEFADFDKDFHPTLATTNADNKENIITGISLADVAKKLTDLRNNCVDEGQIKLDMDETIFCERRQCQPSSQSSITNVTAATEEMGTHTPTTPLTDSPQTTASTIANSPTHIITSPHAHKATTTAEITETKSNQVEGLWVLGKEDEDGECECECKENAEETDDFVCSKTRMQATTTTTITNIDELDTQHENNAADDLFATQTKKHTNASFAAADEDIFLNTESFDPTTTATSESIESIEPHPLSERWSPLGANYDDAISPTQSELLNPESELELLSNNDNSHSHDKDKQELLLLRNDPTELLRLRNSMEEEQELLTSSLMALTSHFAHVQLRVRQIVEAPSHERDQLLKDLEEFAFRGIPEPIVPCGTAAEEGGATSSSSSQAYAQPDDEAVRQRQYELIEHLKTQLCELEKLAYESGAPVLPQHILLEKQKIIIDELKNKLNLQVDEHDLPELSSEELKNQVDTAIGEFVGPLRMKEQLVAQLKTQITDLERFIAFLQCDSNGDGNDDDDDDDGDGENSLTRRLKAIGSNELLNEHYNSYVAKKKGEKGRKKLAMSMAKQSTMAANTVNALHSNARNDRDAAPDATQQQAHAAESLNSKAHSLLDKASLIMQMFASTHFGSKTEQFQKNTLKRTTKGNHWGDLRAQLEVDIQEVASLAATLSFDREKLASMKRALKQAKKRTNANSNNATTTTNSSNNQQRALKAQNGAITIPPRRSLHGKHSGATTTINRKELKAYNISSASDDDSDSDAVADAVDPYDCYAWDSRKSYSRRVHGSSRRRCFNSTHDGGDSIATISKDLTAAVRKNFAMTLLRLIQHGLRVSTESATSSLIVPFMRCLNPSPIFAAERETSWGWGGGGGAAGYRGRAGAASSSSTMSFISSSAATSSSSSASFSAAANYAMDNGNDDGYEDAAASAGFFGAGGSRPMHAWELILEYYYLKNGDEFNNTPARKLSQSFNLEIIDAEAVTAKQSLLSAVGMIIGMHRPYKRSYNAHFKAFVCAGLNCHQLVEWFNLIFSCNDLVDTYYTANSYVARTGFRDSLRSIDMLTKYDFDLPVDLAIRHFRNL